MPPRPLTTAIIGIWTPSPPGLLESSSASWAICWTGSSVSEVIDTFGRGHHVHVCGHRVSHGGLLWNPFPYSLCPQWPLSSLTKSVSVVAGWPWVLEADMAVWSRVVGADMWQLPGP